MKSVINKRSPGIMTTDFQIAQSEIGKFRHSAGDNLILLLGLSVSQKVLIVGNDLKKWSKIYPASTFLASFSNRVCGEFGLIFYHCSCAGSTKELSHHLQMLCKLAGTTGRVLVFAPNAYSLVALKKLKAGLNKAIKGIHCSLGNYRRILTQVGFLEIHEFITLPGLAVAEEFVAPHSSFLELPHYWHSLLHIAHKFGFFWAVADGYLFIAGSTPLDNGQLLSAIGNMLRPSRDKRIGRYTIERFDLRIRGAMVVFVIDQDTGHKLIVRVVSDNKTQKIISHNHKFLKILQTNPDLPIAIKSYFPRPLGECNQAGSNIYVETLLEGILAWKVNRTFLRKRILKEATEFIFRFQKGTSHKTRLGTLELNELFATDLECLAGCSVVSSLLHATVTATMNKIRKILYGRELFLTASHGDYGYGNILVDPKNGELKGVIDWDTGRLCDIPGIDFLNMEVQRTRTEMGCGLSVAFQKISVSAVLRGSIDPKGNYQKYLGISHELLPVLLYLTLIRYLCRAAQYPEVFTAEQPHYITTFEIMYSSVPLKTLC